MQNTKFSLPLESGKMEFYFKFILWKTVNLFFFVTILVNCEMTNPSEKARFHILFKYVCNLHIQNLKCLFVFCDIYKSKKCDKLILCERIACLFDKHLREIFEKLFSIAFWI